MNIKKIICVLGLLAVFITAMAYECCQFQEMQKNDRIYSQAVTEIKNGEYDKALNHLTELNQNENYPDAATLTSYVRLMLAEQEGEEIDSLEDIAEHIRPSYQGVLAEEICAKVEEVHGDYENNDIFEDGDYDWDRYYKDDDYARGVDDAIDELEEDGEDW